MELGEDNTMGIVVQKFGGSSVADAECIKRVAKRVGETFKDGHKVVVVVSAMGDTTDYLLDLAGKITDNPPKRELDMLLDKTLAAMRASEDEVQAEMQAL